mgnify:CR=1 FL=1
MAPDAGELSAAQRVGDGLTCEVDQTGNRFIEELLGGPLVVTDGHIDLGERPDRKSVV